MESRTSRRLERPDDGLRLPNDVGDSVDAAPDARGDAAWAVFARRVETPLGAMLALADDEGLRLLDFLDRPDLGARARALGEALGRAVINADHPHLDAVAGALDAYFAGRRSAFDVPVAPLGSAWQRSVWEALRAIPPGETRSYSRLAATLGSPRASRAVGLANGRNAIMIVVPCHRVIRADGSPCGYAGGPWRKRWLLDHERAGRGSP
jgi:AraC family transcriptional regulator of adaptative response/methylated-DNA-[protein]-cysteine methyltransferase